MKISSFPWSKNDMHSNSSSDVEVKQIKINNKTYSTIRTLGKG